MTTDPGPTSVGQQLKLRREELDLTQEALARQVGIAAPTVSQTERDITKIQRGKRGRWEEALQLKTGTITRAYAGEEALVPADVTPDQAYANMADRYERAIWTMRLSEADRRTLIDIHRAGLDKERHGRATG